MTLLDILIITTRLSYLVDGTQKPAYFLQNTQVLHLIIFEIIFSGNIAPGACVLWQSHRHRRSGRDGC